MQDIEDNYEPPKASTSQFSFYDDDITDLEKSVLGHITNAAFTHEKFYNDKKKDVDLKNDYYSSRYTPGYEKEFTSHPREVNNDEYHYPNSNYYEPNPNYRESGYHVQQKNDHEPNPEANAYTTPRQSPNYQLRSYNPTLHQYGRSNIYVEEPQRNLMEKYPLNSGYHYPYENEYYDAPEKPKSLVENIKSKLPWPLNMVGRMGEGSDATKDGYESKSHRNDYPDSIQSILKNIDKDKRKESSYYVEDHSEYPFLEGNGKDIDDISENSVYDTYEEPQYKMYNKKYKSQMYDIK